MPAAATIVHIIANKKNGVTAVVNRKIKRLETRAVTISNITGVSANTRTAVRAIAPASRNIAVSVFLADSFIPVPLMKIAHYRAVYRVPFRVTRNPDI